MLLNIVEYFFAMSYNYLPSSDKDSHSQIEADSAALKPNSKGFLGYKSSVLLLAFSVANIVCVIILLRFAIPQWRSESGKFIARFSVDYDYQSLDHGYDHVWTDLVANSTHGGFVWTLDGVHRSDEETFESKGVITM